MNMTLPQYQAMIQSIAQKMNWDIVIAQSPISGEVDEDLNPLYLFKSKTKEEKVKNRVMTMADIDKFVNMMEGGN